MTNKAQRELDRLAAWEQSWRIKTHPTKSHITYFKGRNHPRHLYLNSRLPLEERQIINVSNNNTVLGLTYNNSLNFIPQIKKATAIASKALQSLQRFWPASTETKLHLFKTLIRPLLCYSPLSTSLASEHQQYYYQIIQNKALRWAQGFRWYDLVTNEHLHELSNIPALNIYHHFLTEKQLSKLENFHPSYIHKLNNITHRLRPLSNLLHPENRTPPDPIYRRIT